MLLCYFCGLDLFVLTPWAEAHIDVYVPVIEKLEAAVIAAQELMIERDLSTNPHYYGTHAFLEVSNSSSCTPSFCM
jgi:hypothetical protein